MAITVKSDVLSGTSGRLTKDGWEFHRTFTVSGLDTTNGIANLKRAVDALPVQLNAGHPADGRAKLVAFDPSFDANSTSIVHVRATYQTPAGADNPNLPNIPGAESGNITISSSLIQTETNTDAGGALLKIWYVAGGDDAAAGATVVDQIGTTPILVPTTTLTVVRQENASPGRKSRLYTGHVNSTRWSLDPGGSTGAWTPSDPVWLCTGITGDSDDGGRTWVVTYSFQFNRKTWRAEVFYIDEATGRPPADIDDGDNKNRARIKVDIYPFANFNRLNLP